MSQRAVVERGDRARFPSETALVAAGLAALVAFELRAVLPGGGVPYLRDINLQWYGQVESFVHAVASGAPPLWDAYVGFGQPLLANPNAELLYPPTWLNLVLMPWTYYSVFLAGHLFWAGLGANRLARRLGLSAGAAFLAAAAFVASGAVLSLGNLWNHLAAAAWLPWALRAAIAVVDSGSRRGALACGASLAFQSLAGSPDLFVLTSLLVVGQLAYGWLVAPTAMRRARTLLLGVLVFAGALGLAAVQLLPALDLVSRSSRSQAAATEAREYWSLHPLALLQGVLALPGDQLPLEPRSRASAFESREPLLLSIYLGIPLLTLAVAGITGSPRRALGPALAAGAALLFALGPHTPLYSWALRVVPPLQWLRFPAKALIVVALGVALLAGLGLDAWRGTRTTRRVRLFWSLAPAAGVLGGLALWRASSVVLRSPTGLGLAAMVGAAAAATLLVWAGALIPAIRGATAHLAALVTLLDLAAAGRDVNPGAPRDFYRVRAPALSAVPQDDLRRLYVVDYLAEPGLARRTLGRDVPYLVPIQPGAPAAWKAALGMRLYPVPPVAGAWGVLGSYGRDLLGIQPRSQALLHALLVRAEGTPLFARLLRLGAVGYVMTLHSPRLEGLTEVATFDGPFFEPIRVIRVEDPLPRAYVVAGARIATGDEALAAVQDPGFDATREVILAEGAARRAGSAGGQARVTRFANDRVRIEADLDGPGFVVLVDAYDPGWTAQVDGRPARVSCANLAFRAVEAASGRHVIEMTYRPRGLAWGAGLTVATIIGMLILAHPPSPPPSDRKRSSIRA